MKNILIGLALSYAFTAQARMVKTVQVYSQDFTKSFTINIPNKEVAGIRMKSIYLVTDQISMDSEIFGGKFSCSESGEILSCKGEIEGEFPVCSKSREALLNPESGLCSSIDLVQAVAHIDIDLNDENTKLTVKFDTKGGAIKNILNKSVSGWTNELSVDEYLSQL
jgi:hypothetical protein